MAPASSSFARRLWAVRQTLFPSFEPKGYHLQWRHATLLTIMFTCVAFTMPAFPQTKLFIDSDYTDSTGLNVVESYRKMLKITPGIMWYNVGIAAFICLHLIVEPFFERGAPVWFELFWMSLLTIGEIVCLGLMATSRPDVCNFSFGVDPTPSPKLNAKSSATSICSNWRGMNGMLATIILIFLAHMTWHTIVSIRHRNQRRTVFALPITDYRWTLPKERARINETFPGDIEAAAKSSAETKTAHTDSFDYSAPSADYKSSTDGEISFPATVSEDYNNYAHTVPSSKQANLDALPARTQPVIVQQSSITQSDALSISAISETSSRDAPFSGYGRRI
ncbi:hypothetical protein RhiJN_10250 [Ceratobasidium sp. AG-Ba]|nr:hypothetical protein RhiJN_10250 [Ceratobasidium sp. AG-Ba]QRW11003.1 hypothetical protein RhiLY_10002 [Ceratobasidium sp. AG-Ba]